MWQDQCQIHTSESNLPSTGPGALQHYFYFGGRRMVCGRGTCTCQEDDSNETFDSWCGNSVDERFMMLVMCNALDDGFMDVVDGVEHL